MSEKFSSFADFLQQTANQDRQFLRGDELNKIPESVNALANSLGGWVIAGAEIDSQENIIISGLDENIKIFRPDSQIFDSPAKIIIFPVNSLSWHDKPQNLNKKIFRRVEGINLISSKFYSSLMAADSLEFSRDDFPVYNFSLDDESIKNFRRIVIKSHDEYKSLNLQNFLRESFIYSGKYLTFAGALMFGDCLRIRAELHNKSQIISLESKNIWRAYSEILPRLTLKLSDRCADSFREIFINSLLHSDYNIDTHINITINSRPARVIIDNPGTIRGTTRNLRIQKIFSLAGIRTKGLESIKLYEPSFKLNQDMLNFRVNATLSLEGRKIILL